MIYNIKIVVVIDKKNIDNNYYNSLWSILNLLWDDTSIKEWILSVSNIYKRDDWLCNVNISINGKDNFNKIILLIQNKKEINLNWKFYKIKWIDFNFNIFDDNINFIEYKQFEVKFKTPTIVKKEMNGIDINQLLPLPEVFLMSSIRKYNNLFKKDLNLIEIKNKIKNNIIISRFNIYTKLVTIKNNTKAWVVWIVKYELLEEIDNDIKIIIYNALKLAWLIWIWTWVRLGLWQIGVYFNKK